MGDIGNVVNYVHITVLMILFGCGFYDLHGRVGLIFSIGGVVISLIILLGFRTTLGYETVTTYGMSLSTASALLMLLSKLKLKNDTLKKELKFLLKLRKETL